MAKISYYKCYSTGELAPPHQIGEDEEGRALYRFVEGWEPVDSEGREIPGLRSGEDGNWFVDDEAEATAEITWTRADMIAATLEYWGDDAIEPGDCRVIRDPDDYLHVVHVPTGRSSQEAGDGGRWNPDGTAR